MSDPSVPSRTVKLEQNPPSPSGTTPPYANLPCGVPEEPTPGALAVSVLSKLLRKPKSTNEKPPMKEVFPLELPKL